MRFADHISKQVDIRSDIVKFILYNYESEASHFTNEEIYQIANLHVTYLQKMYTVTIKTLMETAYRAGAEVSEWKPDCIYMFNHFIDHIKEHEDKLLID